MGHGLTSSRHLPAAVNRYRNAKQPVALTGAGISVECGIPDFRSPGGLWSVFSPEEYATLGAFLSNPEKAWRLYRALGDILAGKLPGPAHFALAELEKKGNLAGVITQNIDGLHTSAGTRNVLEVHGEYRNLHCLTCGDLTPVKSSVLEAANHPTCRQCKFPLKPNVVLFGEWVREMDKVERLVQTSDLMIVIGTSAEVYPVAALPRQLLDQGGTVIEFNLESTQLTPLVDFHFEGRAGVTVPAFVRAVLNSG